MAESKTQQQRRGNTKRQRKNYDNETPLIISKSANLLLLLLLLCHLTHKSSAFVCTSQCTQYIIAQFRRSAAAPSIAVSFISKHQGNNESMNNNYSEDETNSRDNDDDDNANDGANKRQQQQQQKLNMSDGHQLEDDIAKRLSISRNRAISALSQPKAKGRVLSKLSQQSDDNTNFKDTKIDIMQQPIAKQQKQQKYTNGNKIDELFPKDFHSTKQKSDKKGNKLRESSSSSSSSSSQKDGSFSSLLPPPPLYDQQGSATNVNLGKGLSSWEDFLGGTPIDNNDDNDNASKRIVDNLSAPTKNNANDSFKSDLKQRRAGWNVNGNSNERNNQQPSKPTNAIKGTKIDNDTIGATGRLPSITDLFPPELSSTFRNPPKRPVRAFNSISTTPPSTNNTATPSLDGVLPVSDLFYRSSQSMNEDDDTTSDDEELPFSAEQSDQLISDHNKVKVRRNQIKSSSLLSSQQTATQIPIRTKKRKSKKGKTAGKSRRMIRRGMEMLVGGVPINADPPNRAFELIYEADDIPWHMAISIRSKDFGPIQHTESMQLLSDIELGLYCEHFVHATTKWDVCPKDLKDIAKDYFSKDDSMSITSGDVLAALESVDFDGRHSESATTTISASSTATTTILAAALDGNDNSDKVGRIGRPLSSADGAYSSVKNSITRLKQSKSSDELLLEGKLVFSIAVPQEELLSGDDVDDNNNHGRVLRRILTRGIESSACSNEFRVVFKDLNLTDRGDGTTLIASDFVLEAVDGTVPIEQVLKKAKIVNNSLSQAIDDGDIQLAMAAAAKEETEWPQDLRDRVVEEFLFDEDLDEGSMNEVEVDDTVVDDEDVEEEDYDEDEDDDEVDEEENEVDGEEGGNITVSTDTKSTENDDDEINGMANVNSVGAKSEKRSSEDYSTQHRGDDLFVGGGSDGVFWDYSKSNIVNSPYRGEIGLRLVDAVTQRAKERHPRVIVIGDVHGCIDELQDLLRQCDYRPGDMVIFLGDLVSKGPDSISVVQMAREIGALGVRGNHDFEVIRWHQAIKSGVDPPVIRSEHFYIASCLSNGDMKWMYSLPWYISSASKDLNALFVHAGFVSGIRLAKQNPRLMMNMRSILPDGTVTSKFFNNWPWARLWDGPQTVLFGHDADRGLQQYEHAIGLDTGCVYGGRLTACILPEKRLVSVSARREYFKYRRKHYD